MRSEEDGRIVVRRGGLSLWARPEEVSGVPGDEGGGKPRRGGSTVIVALPAELRRLSPGFYMALGDAGLDLEEPLVRHYWNLESAGGAALIAAGTGVLNEAGVPFRLKVAVEPAAYDRCDAGVLYTPRRELTTVMALLPMIRAAVAAHLRPGTPALTKPLAEGLAVADDPPGGDSFGLHRCGLLAGGAVVAFEAGIDADRAPRRGRIPLRGGRRQLRASLPQRRLGRRIRAGRVSEASGDSAYLEAALRLGREIAASALWSGDRCSWIGAMPEDEAGRVVLHYLAFGPDLYAGTAGVGFVLAELADACDGAEPELRRTALGAFQHAMSRAEEASGPGRLGLLGGRLGIALALARGGAVLGEPGWSSGRASWSRGSTTPPSRSRTI